MNELIIVKQLPEIEEHLRAFKTEIDGKVEEALALVCTEETLQTVKKVRAELNAQFKELEAQRIAVKKQILAPYDAFEAVYKECVSDAFKKGDAELKANIDRVESGLKEQKLEAVEGYFGELCEAEGIDYLSFDDLGIKITLSVSDKKLKEETKEKVLKIKSDIEMIRTQEHADEITVEYRKNGYDVSQAILLVNDRHRRMEEEKKRAESDAERREKEAEAEQKVAEAAGNAAPVTVEEEAETAEDEKVYTVKFVIRATKAQVRDLVKYLDEKGIYHE